MRSTRPFHKFQVQQSSSNNPSEIQIRTSRLGFFVTFLTFLFVCASIGLFAYVNFTFLINMKAVSDKTVFDKTGTIATCQQYYCDDTAYHFTNNYPYYKDCNENNCKSIICTSYKQNSTLTQYITNYNRYYACENDLQSKNVPVFVTIIYSLAVAAAVMMGMFVILPLLYGIFSCICTGNISCSERVSLLLTCFWPSLKYFTFRQRTNWTDVHISFRAMLVLDYLGCLFHAVALAIYIWFFIYRFWKSEIELLNFFFLILTNLVLWSQVARNSKTFWNLNDVIAQHRRKMLT